MRDLAVILVLIAVSSASSGTSATFTFRRGPLRLDFDESTGALVRVARGDAVIAEATLDRSPVSFAIGPKDKPTWLERMRPGRKLIKRQQPAPDTLELTVRVGHYELVERYRLHADLPRVDRSATLVNRSEKTVKLRAFTFRTPGIKATRDGFYRFPKRWPPTSHPFAKMRPGGRRSGGGSIAPLLAQLTPSRSLIWLSCTDDPPHVRVEEGSGQFDVVQGVQAAGYLRPNQPQQIGFVTMQVVDAGYWDALPRLWDWMDSAGIRVPADRPAWVRDAILYEFHPGGTIGSRWRDLGGFKAATEKLLPTIPKLGCTAIWIQPIEYRSPYWPLDYYRFMDGLGTAEEYKALVRRAHELGLKVLQDIVPHGGAPHAVHNKAHPEFMLRREDGSHLNYWLNDFARPDWQDYVGKVAAHYVREYDVDGYRIDACYGSKEMNWDPKIPYARASLSKLWGGLRMVKRIRDEVRNLKPKHGAVLAEVESTRHAAISDFQYDFGLCYNVLHGWRRMPAAEFVPALQEYLEEQKYVNPRGTLFLRHVESHDSLRAQGWYGVEGMRAMYALTAWIQGVPLIYLDQEIGHSFALREINEIRRKRPELSRGEAFYRAVKCETPGVFTCLRKLGNKSAVFVINFGRRLVVAPLSWPGEETFAQLQPLEYLVLPQQHLLDESGDRTESRKIPDDVLAFPDAKEWFVDSIEGRLHDEFRVRHEATRAQQHSSIYWRPQGAPVLWQNETTPLHPAVPRIGVKQADRRWAIVEFGGPAARNVRLIQERDGRKGLHLAGIKGLKPRLSMVSVPRFSMAAPPPPWTDKVFQPGADLRLQCIGPQYIVGNKHFTVLVRRQGGAIRELMAGRPVFVDLNDRLLGDAWGIREREHLLAANHDLYGDQQYFELPRARRIQAANDVECGIRIWKAEDGLHLGFEGQLRGFNRFALKRPPLWYRNEYVFTDAPRFRQRWAFRTEKTFKDKQAFLAWYVLLPEANRFRFLRTLPKVPNLREGAAPPLPNVPDVREGKREVLAEDVVGEGGPRRGQTRGKPAPDRIQFLVQNPPGGSKPPGGYERQWGLVNLKTPKGCECNVFVHGRQFFITLLDGKGAAMEAGRWYEFQADWEIDTE